MTDLAQRLRALRADAPATLVTTVLMETGLADRFARNDSVVGPIFVAWRDSGVVSVDLAGDPIAFAAQHHDLHGRPAIDAGKLPERLGSQIDRALTSGRLGRLQVDLSGLTEFQQAVLRKTAQIPAGEVRPYAWVAKEIGRPGAVRAVGSALAGNPVPLIIPCHRVVRSDGTLGNYSLGDAGNKRVVLAGEGFDLEAYESLTQQGVRLTGSDTTKIFCHPTCRHARRTTTRHEVRFRSEQAARRAGYRPCKVCRPAAAA